MTKQEFIENLKVELKSQPYETVCQAMTYYEEIIDDLVEDGFDESKAISKLGSMKEIIANIEGKDVIEIKQMKKSTSVIMSVLLIFGFPLWGALVGAGICLLLSFYILIWCVPIVTVALGFSGFCWFVVGLFGSFPLFTQSVSLGLTQLGISALSAAISIIGLYLTYITSSKLINYTKSVNKKIKELFFDCLRKVGVVC